MEKKVVNVRYARNRGDYASVLAKIEGESRCPFCPDNFKYHKNPILKTRNGWFITKNSWPYKNTRFHYILVGKEHKEQFSELTAKDLESVAFLVRWVTKKEKILGGGLVVRFGETNHTGASVNHIHFQLIVPQLDHAGHAKVVNFPIG